MRKALLFTILLCTVFGLLACSPSHESKSGVSVGECKDVCVLYYNCSEDENFLEACKRECESYGNYSLEVVRCAKAAEDCTELFSCSSATSKQLWGESNVCPDGTCLEAL